ncbi:hypothetical protein F511_24484 [Dorcoceras hygrometricum]|uniref:Uncharacterized protein n=1 Tax=Dorcoceras hygrometricum TaxID=472368 RepID=A0A2Z7DD64_9LAMI|nr:hypothetical protein F511_24484 [Dorcoceras hygrometricum]
MVASFFVNAVQVDFASVLAMEHTGASGYGEQPYPSVTGFRRPAECIFGQGRPRRVSKAPSSKGVKQVCSHLHQEECECCPAGETSKVSGATASEHQSTVESLPSNKAEREAGEKKKAEKAAVEKPKKKKEKVEKVAVPQPEEAGSQATKTKSKSGTSSNEDSCTLARLKKGGAKRKQVVESSDSEATISVPPMLITKKHRDEGIDQLNFHSAQLGYLKLLQIGTQTQQDKAGNKIRGQDSRGGRHSNPVVTTPTIALDFSDTTQQSASTTWHPIRSYSKFYTSTKAITTKTELNYKNCSPKQLTLAAERSHRLSSKASKSNNFAFPLPAQINYSNGNLNPHNRTKRIEKVPPIVDNQAESQPGPIPEYHLGVTRGQPLVDQKLPWKLHQNWNSKLGEQVKSTADTGTGAGNREKSTSERHGSAPPAHKPMTHTGKDVYAPIEIREINWVTHFLLNIDPADKGKGVLHYLDRPNAVEEHYLLLENAIDGLEIKIDVLESTLALKFADSQQNIAALENGLVHHFADSQQNIVDEVASLKSQVTDLIDCLRELRDAKKREGPSKRGKLF